jgi:predicted enzyme related to lactoylglutathione lyase
MNVRNSVTLWIVALTLSAACSNRAGTTSSGSSIRDEVGRFVWQDLVTDDVASSRRFYGALLGWEFEETDRLGESYTLVRKDGHYVAGITAAKREKETEPIAQWLSYLLVADVDAKVAEAEKAGGRVLVAPVQLSAPIRAAVVTDSQEAPLGLVSYQGDLPFDPDAAGAGSFFWRDYLASNVEGALSFYRSLQGYDAESTSSGAAAHYVLRRSGDKGRPVGGLVGIGTASVRPSWLPYVRVDDPAALARRAIELGGKVLLEPKASVRNGSLAIVADPNGAAVALQKWPI